MKKLLGSTFVCGTLAACALVPATASAAFWEKCSSPPVMGAGPYNVKARNVRCGTAGKVVDDFAYGGNPNPRGFTCTSKPAGYETTVTTCEREKAAQAPARAFHHRRVIPAGA